MKLHMVSIVFRGTRVTRFIYSSGPPTMAETSVAFRDVFAKIPRGCTYTVG